MSRLVTVLAWATALLPHATVVGQPSARSILVRMDSLQDLIEYETVVVEMRLFENDEQVRGRKLQLQTSNDNGQRKALAIFIEPADIRGMGVLMLDSGSKSDQRLYLPALQRIQRITGSQRKDRFAASDLSFEDLRAREPDDYRSTVIETRSAEWVLSLEPLDDDSPYSRIDAVVDSDKLVITSARYFDRDGDLYKILESRDFVEVEPGIWQADVMVMQDVKEERRTELFYERRDTKTPIPSGTFSERQLRRGL